MDDMFSKISELLQNPEALEQVKGLASGLSAGSDSPSGGPELFSQENMSKLMQGSKSQKKNIALLHAIEPYMRRERAQKIDSAIKAIQILSLLNTLK